MSKTRKRYVVELTKAQLEALKDCTCRGIEECVDDPFYYKTWKKGKEAYWAIVDAQENGLKTLK